MTHHRLLATAALLLTSCPGPDPETNPSILWLAPDNSEVIVKLSAIEPDPW